jgi:hypothetical protein
MLLELVKVEVHSTVSRLVLPGRLRLLARFFELVLADVAIEFAVKTCNHLLRLCLAKKFAVSALSATDRI